MASLSIELMQITYTIDQNVHGELCSDYGLCEKFAVKNSSTHGPIKQHIVILIPPMLLKRHMTKQGVQ